MHPIFITALLSLAAALPATPVASQNDKAVVRTTPENSLVEARSIVNAREDSEAKHVLNAREVYFSKSYDWPSETLYVLAVGISAAFWVEPNGDNTYILHIQNAGPANGLSYKFTYTAPGADTITQVLAGGGNSAQYTIKKSGSQFKVEVSSP
ncbi:hypothetical protein F5X99DRAFT_397651 [Biscogniauxia marginata]|nr:hypothetical protein F5X99DRAFT_397651 [Biscogniauxia marginata]